MIVSQLVFAFALNFPIYYTWFAFALLSVFFALDVESGHLYERSLSSLFLVGVYWSYGRSDVILLLSANYLLSKGFKYCCCSSAGTYLGLRSRVPRVQTTRYPAGKSELGGFDYSPLRRCVVTEIYDDIELSFTEQSGGGAPELISSVVDETVVFHDERLPTTNMEANMLGLPGDLGVGARDGRVHTIVDILQRPIPIRRTRWLSTHAPGDVIAYVDFPKDPLSYSMFKQKVAGFLGFKADLHVRLQVNGNKFQQGRLFLAWVPDVYRDAGTGAQYPRASIATSSLLYSTQLLRKDFDISTDTDVSLDVPYMSSRPYYDTITGGGNAGFFIVVVYSGLISASSELEADLVVWSTFKNVELVYPSVPGPSFVAQMGGVQEAEQSAKSGDRPLSSSMQNFAAGFGELAKIPLLSTIARPASWAFGVGADLAYFFGFSKPVGMDASRMTPKFGLNMANCDGVDNSAPLSMTQNNSVRLMSGVGGTDLDEMSLSYCLAIPTFVRKVTWPISASAGDLLTTIALCPEAYDVTSTVVVNTASVTRLDTPPLGYVARMFDQYRGSIGFKFKFVKTSFHAGRLKFCFAPGDLTAMAQDYNNSAYLYSEVVDIMETTVFTFIPPYSSTVPHRSNNARYGSILIFVQNDLRAPDTVMNYVEILCEVFAGKDFSFSIPKEIQWVTYLPTTLPTWTAGTKLTSTTTNSIVAQAGGVEITEVCNGRVERCEDDIATARVADDPIAPFEYCVGEKILSFRQMLQRSSPSIYPVGATTDFSFFAAFTHWANGVAPPGGFFGNDAFSFVCALFRFRRGGMRFKAYIRDATNNKTLRVGLERGNAPLPTVPQFSSSTVTGNTFVPITVGITPSNPVIEWSIPHYHDKHVFVNDIDYAGFAGNAADYGRNRLHLRSESNLDRWFICRSIAEDFQFAGFMGTVPLVRTDNSLVLGLPTPTW